MQAFWKQWQREYLTGLGEKHSSHKNKNILGEPVARGKVVLIHDQTPWNQWKLGVIVQLHWGRIGWCALSLPFTLRAANALSALCHYPLPSGDGNLITRPFEKLCPLEVLAKEYILHDSKEKFKNPEEIRSTSEKRTQWAAAELSKLNEL